ncbi:hypothetical protein NC651_039788 [Populus alba x Populus x berolinensis]|nr:hypothetical protein NC651_039788 [Populus alba x Populus x berolinensis]
MQDHAEILAAPDKEHILQTKLKRIDQSQHLNQQHNREDPSRQDNKTHTTGQQPTWREK